MIRRYGVTLVGEQEKLDGPVRWSLEVEGRRVGAVELAQETTPAGALEELLVSFGGAP